jgi:hypothetical protein
MAHKSSFHKIIFLIFILNLINSSGYTVAGGIEKFDVVNLDYVLSYDGEVQQNGPNFETRVSSNDLIDGFYEGLLGMSVGEDKNIIVPPEKGYSTGDLAGKTLYFDVHINAIVSNNRGDDYVEPTEETISSDVVLFLGSSNNDSIIGNIFGSPVFQAVMGILVIGVIYVKSIGK